MIAADTAWLETTEHIAVALIGGVFSVVNTCLIVRGNRKTKELHKEVRKITNGK